MDEKIRTYLWRVCTRDLYHQPNILQRQLLPTRHWEKVSRRERGKERKKVRKKKRKGGREKARKRERQRETERENRSEIEGRLDKGC